MTRIWLTLPIVVWAIPTAAAAQVAGTPVVTLSAVSDLDDFETIRPARPLEGHQDWLSVSDFPIEAFDGLYGRYVSIDITVNADDTLGQCTPGNDTNSALLGERVCQLIRERGRFLHALDAEGLARRGHISMSVFFRRIGPIFSGGPMPAPPAPVRRRYTPPILRDSDLLKLPSNPAIFPNAQPAVALDIDADGRVTRCKIFSSAGTDVGDMTLCRQLKGARFEPAQDSDGRPTSARGHYVRMEAAP